MKFLEGFMHIKNKKGQSTVEYVLLVTAVIAVIIAFTTGTGQNSLQGQLNSTLNAATLGINTEASQLVVPWGGTTPNAAASTTPPYTVNVVPGSTGS